jgi:signal transduction histidine kinase
MSETQPVDGTLQSGTYLASAARATREELQRLSEQALADPILKVVLATVSGHVLMLDQHRQIIAANDSILRLLEKKRDDSILGLRPGEAMHCVNARRGPGGCGTSVQCRHCGAVAAILAAQVAEQAVEGHCAVVSVDEGVARSMELRLRVTPLLVGSTRLYVLTFHDVTASKRREMLEGLFFHDLGNLVGGLVGWSEELLEHASEDEVSQVVGLAHRLEDYLKEHRLLLQADSGTLQVRKGPVAPATLAESLRSVFHTHSCAADRHLQIELHSAPVTISTDELLLHRVLCNLLKNAFEASPRGSTVSLRVLDQGDRCVFEVRNEGVLPQEAAERLFKTQFSTKGAYRGLGTFAVQILGEQCLGGEVTFESNEETGTVFRFDLPKLAEQPT